MGDMPPGSVFAGHRIEAVAGRGGMGVVYRARQLSLDRIVALKVIAPALMADESIRRRFLRESRVAASIDHPHVIPIFYAGEADGVAYIAMRHVAGDDLRTLVRREGPLDAARAARVIGQTAAALDAAHASGLVHRDVKPANVLLGQGDHAYLTDFGLTKHVLSEAGATKPGHWVGTLDFIAPEQIRGERVDARSDVYALGCVLYYMLTGRPPFTPEGDEAKLWAHLTETPPAPSKVAPGVPAAFDDVIARALAKAPEQRFQSAGDLGRAAAAAATGGRSPAADTIVATGAAAPIEIETRTAGTALAPPDPPAAEPRSGRRLPVMAVSIVALLAVAGVLAALAMRGEGTPPPEATATATPAATPKVERITIGGRPNIVAGGGGRVWAGRFTSQRMVALDPSTGEVLKAPRPRIGEGLNGLAISGRDMWALSSRRRVLLHLDAVTGRPLAEPVPLPGAGGAVLATPDSVYVALTQPELDPGDQVLEFDADTGALRRTIDVRDGIRRLALARGRLWLLASAPAALIGIDLADPSHRVRSPLESETAGDLTVGEGYLWATLPGADTLARVGLDGGRPAQIPTGRGPAGVLVRKGIVWVVNRTESTLRRIRIANSRPIKGKIPMPLNPYEIAAYRDAIWVTGLTTGKIARVTDLDG
jgi:hypothetical protein